MSISTRPRGPGPGTASLEGPFIGRAAELDRLFGALEDALDNERPQFVLVDGAAGIGKSRLVREFLAAAREKAPAAAVLQGRCLAANRGVSYWALGEMLRRACGIGLDDRADDAETRLRNGVGRALAPLGLTEARSLQALHALALSAGIAVPGNPLERGEPRIFPALLTYAWSQLLTAQAQRGGAIVVIEDLHWAGSAMTSALPAIVAKVDGPLLMVATARPAFLGREPGFMAGLGLELLDVGPLNAADAAGLANALLPVAGLSDELRAMAVARSEGNPYFLEETVRHLVESGAAERTAIPSSIQSVLVARIEVLPLAERRVLQEASVVGRIFWEGPIRQALGAADVGDSLRRLAERGLVYQRPTSSLSGEVEWSFKHALLRDAAYGTMTTGHRARSHASVGGWLHQIAGDHETELAGLIAEHFRQAVEQDQDGLAWPEPSDRERVRETAVRYLLTAGTSAHQRYSIDKAVELHEAALRHARTDAERARALTALGLDHESGLDGPKAVDAYRRAMEPADAAPLPADERARIRLGAARTMAIRWGAFPVRPNPAEIDTFVDAGLALAEDAETRLWLLAMKGASGMRWDASRLSDPEFIEDRRRAVAAARDGALSLGLADLSVVASRVAGQLEFAAGRYPECAAEFRALVPHLDDVQSTFQRALTSLYAVLALADVEGAYGEALPIARSVLELSGNLSAHEHAHGTSSVLWCLYHVGGWSEAEGLVEEHLAAVRGSNVFVCSFMRSGPPTAALIAAHLGDAARARELLDQVDWTGDEPGLPEGIRARVLVAIGDADAGVAAAQEMIDSGRVPGLEEGAQEWMALVEGLQALSDWERLRGFLPEARRHSAALAILGPTCDRAEGSLAAADGDKERAAVLLRRALEAFERYGVPYEVARTKTLLAGVLPDGDAMLAEAIAMTESLVASAGPPAPASGSGATPAGESPLTEREREILALIGEGISNQEIAERLVLSQRTVERHVSNIYLKLGFEGRSARAAAASYAVRSSIASGID